MRKKSFKTESKRLLDLMINSIYTNREIFLREIISNASDALDKLHYLSLTDQALRKVAKNLEIGITIDRQNKTITVCDNGVGMNEAELEENLGTIAKSGSLQFKEEMGEEKDNNTSIIGQFGVGFYSAFMVADDVTVISKKYDSDTAYKWNSNGIDGYTVEPCDKESFGTEIIMHVKDDTDEIKFSEFLDSYRIQGLIRQYSDYIHYPIKMEVETSKNVAKENEEPKWEAIKEIQTINSMKPIWQCSKKEASDEECAKWYKNQFFDFQDPALTIRVAAEGVISYKAMLFVPSALPYGFFTKEFEKGLQLYCNGVLIMDKCEQLLPDHFRFVKGVVDSPDLTLNISRETLQNDNQLKLIATNIEKKIKSELAKLQKNDAEKYASVWKNFGTQIKYGIVSDYGTHKDTVKDLLVFSSSKGDELTTLKAYVERMPESQKFIYFAAGESVAKIAALPQIEICRDKGFEILYLTEDIDTFVINELKEFEGKEFKSVDADDSGLISDQEKSENEAKQTEMKELCDFVKETLGDEIVDCVISNKLKSHPVFLSAKGNVTIEMEKYFAQIPGTPEKVTAQKVLELNGNHESFAALKAAFENDKEKAAKFAKIYLAQAKLIAGLEIDNPAEYTDMICSLMK